MKNNEHILSNQQAFQEAHTRAREVFGKIEGVVGVGLGQKKTDGEYKDDIAIVVFVREKKREEDLPPDQRIPPLFEGYRTDVRVVEQAVAESCDNTTHYDKIQGGIQIEIRQTTNTRAQGTLGCIVKKRNYGGRENVYLLTNKHVLFPYDSRDDHVYHPTPDGDSLGPIQAVAFYANFPFPPDIPASPSFFIDCAIGRIDLDSTCFGSTCTKDHIKYEEALIVDLQVNGVNSISDVRSVTNDVTIIGQQVFKVGRTTSKTTGIVRGIQASFTAQPEPEHPAGPIAATNALEITFDVSSTPNGLNCKGNPRFTEQGDSGSIIIDGNNRAIGIHSHGLAPGPGASPSFACHIAPVLDYLGICIPTTGGTSHGSSGATDGSGAAPIALSFVQSTLPAGQIVFTAQQVDAELARSPDFTKPVAVTDDEEHHMRELLQAFRSTQKGRELHAVFADVRREIGYLVRNCRPVKVAWHRNKGPAFFAHALNHLKGYSEHIPREVDGISLGTLLTRMHAVLSKHGSHKLRRAIEQHGDDLLSMLAKGSCNCVQDCIAYLQEKEVP